jgi:sulfur-oxidizing protein SoxY
MPTISRRGALQLGAGLTLSLLAVEQSAATPAEADGEIAKFTGGQSAKSGKIAIDLPDIAENGNTVPLSIRIDSPMNVDDYVSDILILTDGNPYPGVAKFQLSPMSGRAEAAMRIRLNTTENVIVVAKTSAGKIFADRRLVKVTVGGCGG